MRIALKKWITWYLVLAMFVIGITPKVYAGFSPSDVIGLSPADRSSDLKKIQKFLETKMVRERLKEFGLTPEEIQTRLSPLSDQQIHQLALKLDELMVGGNDAL
ncbi:MAG: PA2779 family protein [Deltaproteobacteria bacterium]|nr:PA2779 family protein [Deltaproteobacteria bacterium]